MDVGTMTAGVRDDLIAMLAVGAEGTGGPVDIDLSFLVLIALFLFLMIYYHNVLFRPYLRIRDIREQRIAGAKQAAKATDARADRVFDEYEQKLAEVVEAGAAERKRIRDIAKREEREIVAEARAEMEAMLREAQADLDKELERARSELEREAGELSKLIAERVLAP